MWLSRRAFDALLEAHAREVGGLRDEIAFLRSSHQQAVQHNRKMERVDRGLGELEPRRKDPADEHLPAPVQRIIALYEEPSSRAIVAASIKAARANGDSWPTIERELKAGLPAHIVQALEEKADAP